MVIGRQDVLRWIERADEMDLNDIMQAIVLRHHELFPQWELMMLTMPLDDSEEQSRSLEGIIDFLRVHYRRKDKSEH